MRKGPVIPSHQIIKKTTVRYGGEGARIKGQGPDGAARGTRKEGTCPSTGVGGGCNIMPGGPAQRKTISQRVHFKNGWGKDAQEGIFRGRSQWYASQSRKIRKDALLARVNHKREDPITPRGRERNETIPSTQ